ncbi:hypothetical protein MESS2_740066 [Mesorhizobium metallidurans STM 2683]|uniref:Uncharacterized protein n=1 Tax=Mesorhizobium metallidurans STM 2683 TaxID=1297569 RepID=M5ETX8_9HYPH|nr:hypothetical protein MESS2_740066 [Mesorhizobium metallidurans STM 2683]
MVPRSIATSSLAPDETGRLHLRMMRTFSAPCPKLMPFPQIAKSHVEAGMNAAVHNVCGSTVGSPGVRIFSITCRPLRWISSIPGRHLIADCHAA